MGVGEGGSVGKNPLSDAGDMVQSLAGGTKTPHTVGQAKSVRHPDKPASYSD